MMELNFGVAIKDVLILYHLILTINFVFYTLKNISIPIIHDDDYIRKIIGNINSNIDNL